MFLNSLFLFYSICFIAFGHFVYLYYIISVIRIIPFSSGSLSTLWPYCTAWDLLFLDRYDFRIKEKTRELSAYIRKVLWSYVVEVVTTRVLRPWMGATLISTTKRNCIVYGRSMCQCPERGDPHFYIYTLPQEQTTAIVSMPWKGRPSFLPYKRAGSGNTGIKRCQCPERGDPHFYLVKGIDDKILDKYVSMPWKGRPSFQPRACNFNGRGRYCVNALKGATLISTLASGNPHK